MAIYVDPKTLTSHEITSLRGIINERVQPLCPGCGQPMALCISNYVNGGYSGNYMCRACCGWATQTVQHKDIVYCASQAYNRGIAVTDEIRELQRNRRRRT